MSAELVKYAAGVLALREARKELVAYTDPARLAQEVARGRAALEVAKLAKDSTYMRLAIEYQAEAERCAGILLAAMPMNTGTRSNFAGRDSSGAIKVVAPENSAPTLASLGITFTQSARWKQVAAMADASLHAAIDLAARTGKSFDACVRHIAGVAKKAARKASLDKQAADIAAGITKPDGFFDVIVVDPPWHYGGEYDPDTSRVVCPYPQMTQAELLAMQIPAAHDCVLFLWTTHQFIFDARALLDAWGFSFKALLIWDKQNLGMGRWVRMQCEFCLLATKGHPYWANTTERDIICEPRRQHSRKPEGFYALVEQCTAGRRLDWFARSARPGWAVIGNDVAKFGEAA